MRKHDWPFGIYDLIPMLGIETKNFDPSNSFVYAKCPLCGDHKFRMKIFRETDNWVCFHCGEHGVMLDLYAQVALGYNFCTKESRSAAYRDIKSRLGISGGPAYYEAEKRTKAAKAVKKPQTPIADVADRNATYKALLNLTELELTDEHYDELYSRGFGDEVIETNGYRSFSPDLKWAEVPVIREIYTKELKPIIEKDQTLSKFTPREICAGLLIGMALEAQGCVLKGVPGFFKIANRWLFRVRSDSILIPLRNERGQIHGMQLRLQSSKLRYMTISSSKFPGGCAPREWYHFPLNAPGYGESNSLVLTEGPLKGDAFSVLCPTPLPVICITGVNLVRDLPKVFETAKANGIDYVINALDMDRLLNKQVRQATRKIRSIVKKAGLKMLDLCWDAERAKQHCDIMCGIAREHGVQLPDKLPENVYARTQAIAAVLDSSKIEHPIRWDANDASVKRKGIDDVWLAYLRSK